jgi:hypothetical protein
MKNRCLFSLQLFLFLVSTQVLPGQNLIWQKQFGHIQTGNQTGDIRDLAVVGNGLIYSTGYIREFKAKFGDLVLHVDSTIPRDPGPDFFPEAAFLACQNAQGDYLWVKSLNGNFSFNHTVHTDFVKSTLGEQVAIGPDGNVYMAGFIEGDTLAWNGNILQATPNPLNSPPGLKHFVIKLDPNGIPIWSRFFPFDEAAPTGITPGIRSHYLEWLHSTCRRHPIGAFSRRRNS